MAEGVRIQTVSRSAWLELKDEQKLVSDGYEFLDEKAILLAAEMLEQRDAYRRARNDLLALCERASATLRDAAADQGLDGLQVYPAAVKEESRLDIGTRPCIGQIMLGASLTVPDAPAATAPSLPTASVERCRKEFGKVIEAAARMAAMTANLSRLTREYRRTSRRVRALENVILPEIRSELAAMEEHLELIEQEEVIRVRTMKRDRKPGMK